MLRVRKVSCNYDIHLATLNPAQGLCCVVSFMIADWINIRYSVCELNQDATKQTYQWLACSFLGPKLVLQLMDARPRLSRGGGSILLKDFHHMCIIPYWVERLPSHVHYSLLGWKTSIFRISELHKRIFPSIVLCHRPQISIRQIIILDTLDAK